VEYRAGRFALAIRDFFAIGQFFLKGIPSPVRSERPFRVRTGGGHDAHLQPAKLVDLVVVDLRKHELLAQTEGVVAMAIERLGSTPRKSRMRRERDVEQLVEEVEHAPARAGSLWTPMGIPSRSLNAATDFFARMTIGAAR